MIDLQTYIIILLSIAGVGMYYIFKVIREQRRLFKYIIRNTDIRKFRKVLFAISVVIVVCGLIPIAINLYTLFIDDAGRPDSVSPLSLIYSLGVHIQSLLLSYLLWQIYKLAAGATDGDATDNEKNE